MATISHERFLAVLEDFYRVFEIAVSTMDRAPEGLRTRTTLRAMQNAFRSAIDRYRMAPDRLGIIHQALLDIDAVLEPVLADREAKHFLRSVRLHLGQGLVPSPNVFHLAGQPTLRAVLKELRSAAARTLEFVPLPDARPRLSTIRDIVPHQKIAPAQFTIREGRLAIAPQPGVADTADLANIAAARRQLLGNGQRLLEEIKASNCDKRFIATFECLQGLLASEQNIIDLGLTNMGCDLLLEGFEHELSDVVVAMLRAHTAGVGMYVAQFPDWSRFVDNAAAVDLQPAETAKIAIAAKDLAAELSAKPDLAEPEVPATLARLAEMLADPAKASKRAAFAVLRTIENLVSKVFSYAVDFLDQTVEKTTDKLSGAVSKVAVVTLLTVALGSAGVLTPVAEHIQEVSWIKSAVELVKQQIDELSK